MKVEMKHTRSGSPDGLTVVQYKKNAVVDLPESLAAVFLDQGWAKKVTPRRTKNSGAAPENKTRSKKRREHGT